MALRLNPLDRAIGFFSPATALRRGRAREALELATRGGYEGARTDHRGSSWRTEPSGANTSLYGDLPRLRDRARSLVRNVPIAKRAIEILVAHTVGTGIVPSFKTTSKSQQKRLANAWKSFVDTADARRQTTAYGLQEQAVRGMFEAGETLSLRDRRMRNGTPVLSYLTIEGDQLDHNREGIFEGRVTRLGVALEKGGFAPDGYWLYDQNPGDAIQFGMFPYSRFVPADGVTHLYRIRRAGMVRGVSELAAAMPIIRDLADYWEAAIVKARAEAAFVGIVRSDDNAVGSIATRQVPAARDGGAGIMKTLGAMEPGMFHRLNAGEDITFSQPSPNPNLPHFMLSGQQQFAVGTGVTHDQATGDLRQANYSSLKAGRVEFRRMIEMIQHLTVIPMYCAPIYRDFIVFGRTFGDLVAADERVPVEWIPPAWEPIDPIKDMQADILAVRSGRITWDQFVLAWGCDPQEQLAEIARINQQLDDLDLTLDIDPRRVSAGGQTQPGEAMDGTGKKSTKVMT